MSDNRIKKVKNEVLKFWKKKFFIGNRIKLRFVLNFIRFPTLQKFKFLVCN